MGFKTLLELPNPSNVFTTKVTFLKDTRTVHIYPLKSIRNYFFVIRYGRPPLQTEGQLTIYSHTDS